MNTLTSKRYVQCIPIAVNRSDTTHHYWPLSMDLKLIQSMRRTQNGTIRFVIGSNYDQDNIANDTLHPSAAGF